MKNDILIIILNWNGATDTTECVRSLLGCNPINFDIFILDNNSRLEEYSCLQNELYNMASAFDSFSFIDRLSSGNVEYGGLCYDCIFQTKVYLLKSDQNQGFAKGCNLGARFAEDRDYKYILFLNNDTTVDPLFIKNMIESFSLEPNIRAVIPQIRYYNQKDNIWNCGGEISKYGNRKYYFANKRFSTLPVNVKYLNVTFVTGCCLLFETDFFRQIGRLSERFFFGEEDIELSLRMLKSNCKMICALDSIVYHKVGSSIKSHGEKSLRKAYVHYLNRFINMKLHLKIFWPVWLIPSSLKVIFNLIKINKISPYKSFCFTFRLIVDACKNNEVNKEKFESIIFNGY